MTNIEIQPIDMTQEIMSSLEDHGMIIRLCPGCHDVDASEGQVGVNDIYTTDVKFGTHKLISATINRDTFSAFGSHPDNEDVFLIGNQDIKDLFFLFSYLKEEELNKRIKLKEIQPSDFIVIRAKFNDPYVSFFTVLKDVPHGEATIPGIGVPPSFYVTEPSDLPIKMIDFNDYEVKINELF